VETSFPNKAAVSEKRVPVSCIPSPESPENLITTSSLSITSVFFTMLPEICIQKKINAKPSDDSQN
jgi:hypothetical protein